MDYVYDIVLNLQDEYYDFYEWYPTDKIINIKKIPIYRISNSDYLNIKYHDAIIDKKTLPKNSKLFLLTSGIEIMGILLGSNNKVIKKSSLIFEEADDILNDKNAIKSIKIKYTIVKKHKLSYQSRITKEKSQYITDYLTRIYHQKDKYYLKYLYYDIYNIDEDDIDKIFNELLALSKRDVIKFYHSIKKVNLELNKP